MPPKKKPLTDDEKYQQSLIPEKELMFLKRRYIEMDRDLTRSQYTRGSKLARQDKILGIFMKEHNSVLTDLLVATTPEKRLEDKKLCEKLQFLLDEYNYYDDEVSNQRLVIKETDGEIRAVKKRIIGLTAKQTTDRQHQDRIKHAMKTLEALENKLEVQVRKFCGICSKNRELREMLHHLLRERHFFMVTWNTTISHLQKGKKIMMDLIEQATIAYDQREEWVKKVQALRNKARKDFQESTHKMRILQRERHYNATLTEFFGVKSQKRVMRQLMMKEKIKRLHLQAKIKDRIDNYNNMLRQITNFYGDEQISQLIQHFYRQEQENFSRFRYVNDIQSEMEAMGEELGYLHIDIDERRLLNDERLSQQSERIKNYEKDLQAAIAETSNEESTLKALNQNLDNMMQGIGNLFKICRAKNDPIIKLLGNNAKIQHYNVILYLQVLENKVHEMFLKKTYKERIMTAKVSSHSRKLAFGGDVEKESKRIFRIDEIIDMTPCALCIEREMVAEVVDCLQVAWSRDKVEHKLKKILIGPDSHARLHNVSNCALPKAREIMQRRYQ